MTEFVCFHAGYVYAGSINYWTREGPAGSLDFFFREE